MCVLWLHLVDEQEQKCSSDHPSPFLTSQPPVRRGDKLMFIDSVTLKWCLLEEKLLKTFKTTRRQ